MGCKSYTNLIECVRILCDRSEICRKTLKKYLHPKEGSEDDVDSLMLALSELLLRSDCTLTIARCLPHHVLELIILAEYKTTKNLTVSIKTHHKQMCIALGKLVNIHPDSIRYSLQYFEKNVSPFSDVADHSQHPSSTKKRKISLDKTPDADVTDLEIVQSCYSFLKTSNEYFRQIWKWSDFIKLYVGHSDDFICWMACQCIADVTGMTDAQRQTFVNAYLSPESVRTSVVKFDSLQTDYSNLKDDIAVPESESTICKVSDVVVTVSGIQLPVFNSKTQNKNGCLVLVNSTESNLKSLALAVASGRAICLQGPVGSGKTSLVEHLSLLTGRNTPPHFHKVQLGDQTDSKMLLGSYRCTDVPGEFVWQPGVLTQAVVGGHWILLEDIDSAAADVATVLISLMETGTLSVPGYRDCIKVAPGFQLFVTKRLLPSASGFHSQHLGATAFLEKHWVQINVEPLSKQELVTVVQTMFPVLRTIATRIVDVFLLFSVGNHNTALQVDLEALEESNKENACDNLMSGVGRRLISTRDLIKWCTRCVEGFDVSSQESALKVLQDAIDIFCCSVTSAETRLKLASSIGACLGIVKTKAEYFCNNYKPTVKLTALTFNAGRVSLPRRVDTITKLDSASCTSSFSFTRPAACLLERVVCCVAQNEPVLLVGETGTGKTSAVQYLAEKTGHRLVVINMNQQSDSADLLGGYKPVDLKYIVGPVREEFETLFRSFFSVQQNHKFLEHIATCFNSRHWSTLLKLMKHSQSAAMKRLLAEDSTKQKPEHTERRKAWQQLGMRLHKLENQLKTQSALAFSFIEGSLVKALKKGDWVLLDEINLASAETLECLSGLLEGSAGSLCLLERGDQESIIRHPDFRLFACMNPATDVGKKDLPAGLRNRFTEFFVDELTEKSDLMLLVGTYLRDLSLPITKLENIVKFYLSVKMAASTKLTDGTGHKPHYSLRTLCRALSVAALNKCGSVPRSLYEALCLSFLTQLDYSSHPIVEQMVAKAVAGTAGVKNILTQPIPAPVSTNLEEYVCFEGYWIPKGKLEPNIDEKYILTPSVRSNLRDIVRIVSIGRHPVLLQGETSVGKTSLITYLAKASGNHCVRINNHEHTDLQEYIGSYSADERGCLVFREGVLVEAMRKGHWIILDELNLAPTDVLEALNRVLDDNRELFIPETQETVKAHPHFMLFATQNPPGLYGGRKMLSRAFRNRFVELHFDEIPANELEIILHKRCDMPLSYCKKMVAVMTDLQLRRRGSAAFAGKQGFITLRDLFRWGERYRQAGEEEGTFYDWNQHVADEGYLVLAGRVRKREECDVIQEVIKKYFNKTVLPEKLFTLNEQTSSVTRPILEQVLIEKSPPFKHIVWTYNMRRLAVQVGKACRFKEPVLLVGETGCGKTTVCQVLAALDQQALYTVNCHMHTESSDFLGGLRPVREHSSDSDTSKLFEWVDGPLIEAMQKGGLFLADEISLADDSVLERLNSLLEPERKLLLAEKGGDVGTDLSCVVTAVRPFHFIGTMNPGGDYGKKELSPALRNRFTEIWCESYTERKDLLEIIEHNLNPGLLFGNQEDGSSGVGNSILDFIEWFTSTDIGKRFTVSIRDILSWVHFINACTEDSDCRKDEDATRKLDLPSAYIHGACLTFLDSLGAGITSIDSRANLEALHTAAVQFLMKQIELGTEEPAVGNVVISDTHFGIHPFYIKKGCLPTATDEFTFSAPTTGLNACRVLRGLQLTKPILLEGSPGVGKTSLVAALAKASGHQLTRINVSEQTDVSDLFGADLPIEGGDGGQFAWRDGPFLQALKAGHWILLDELNLASQSVLEGLNACFDHRGEVFVPELGKTFHIQSENTRIFGAQNPLRQGGARRGLPQSFLNRFTQVYIDSLTECDLEFILRSLFPTLPHNLIVQMVKFNSRLVRETGELRLWGQRGSPWELNLRDLSRWCEATIVDFKKYTSAGKNNAKFNPGKFVDLIYVDRMRTREDKEKVKEIYMEVLGSDFPLMCSFPQIHVTHSTLFIDDICLSRDGLRLQNPVKFSDSVVMSKSKSDIGSGDWCQSLPHEDSNLMLLRKQFPALRSLARCINMNWMVILVGATGSGKTSILHLLSQILGQDLRVLSVNSAMDTTEILGGFEQADYNRHLDEIATRVERLLLAVVRRRLLTPIDSTSGSPRRHDVAHRSCGLLCLWEDFKQLTKQGSDEHQTLTSETELFNSRLSALQKIVSALLNDHGYPQPDKQDFESEVRNLESGLNKLSQKVAKEGSLNAGGKFEWIDSVLVKCLQDGNWLLVDNVNLCSPAVLDRLNALLEPGGVLTIGERGVGPDGQLVTITPHPGFRLFLSMDPHNGEISRAMRNRGVEIYLLGPQEEEYNSLDIRSLLYHAGLELQQQQDTLLAVHQEMRQISSGLDEPSISQLLQAAHLITQQISLGQPLYQAFLSSCSDIYVKSHVRSGIGSSGFRNFKQKLYLLLKETLKSSPIMQETVKDHAKDKLEMNTFTLTTHRMKEDAAFVTVKQEGSLLKVLMEEVVTMESENKRDGSIMMDTDEVEHFSSTRVLDELFDVCKANITGGIETSMMNIENLVPVFILMFYETASLNDTHLRHEWLMKLISKLKRKNNGAHIQYFFMKLQMMCEFFKRTLNEISSSSWKLHECLVKCIDIAHDLPWDIRWLPNVERLCNHNNEAECSLCASLNKLSLLLAFAAKKIQSEKPTEEALSCKRRSLKVLEYSTAVMQGTLTDDITNHCVVTKFTPLIHQFDNCLEAVLKSEKTSLSVAQFGSFYEVLAWRFRFSGLGEMQLISSERQESGRKSANLVEEVVSKLSVHYNWLKKWTIPELQRLLDEDEVLKKSNAVKELECTLKVIDASMEVSSSALLPIGKKVKNIMGQPVPHVSSKQAELWKQIQRLSEQLCVWQSNFTSRSKSSALISFLQTQTGMKARLNLINAYCLLSSEESIDQVSGVIKEVEKSCQSAGLTACNSELESEKEDSIKTKVYNDSDVQLWPLHELICLLLNGALKRALLHACNTASDISAEEHYCQDINKNLNAFMTPLPSIPCDLLSVIKLATASTGQAPTLSVDKLKQILPELLMLILRHSQLSPSVFQLSNWLSWKQEASDAENVENAMGMDWIEMEENVETSFPLHCPLMTKLVTTFILPNCQSIATSVTLGAHLAQKEQLSRLKEVLWRNMTSLSSSKLNYELNDALSVELHFKSFLQSISKAVLNTEVEMSDETYADTVQRIVQALNNDNNDDGKYATSKEAVKTRKQFSDAMTYLSQVVVRLRSNIDCTAQTVPKDVSNMEMLVATGEAWTLIGFLQVALYADLGLIDPVEKRKLKLQYVSEELEETRNMLYAQDLQSRVRATNLDAFEEDNLHPLIAVLRHRLQHLTLKQKDLKKYVAVRPDSSMFNSLAKEAHYYSTSLASADTALNMHKRIVDMIKKLDTAHDTNKIMFINEAEEILREEKIWQQSQLMFCEKMKNKYYSWYPDMVVPLLSAATQLCYGMRQLASILHKKIIQTKVSPDHGRSESHSLDKLLNNLVRFPSLGEDQESLASLVDTCTSDAMTSVVNKALADRAENDATKETYQLLKSSLEELRNLVMIRGELQSESREKILELLGQMVKTWRMQEDERKQKEIEQESLFVTKCKTLSDEEQDAVELAEMFPTSITGDFGDLQETSSLDQAPTAVEGKKTTVVGIVSEQDMDFICQLHSHMMQSYTYSAWLYPAFTCRKYAHLVPDFIKPLLQRYATFSLLMEKLSRSLDSSLDTSLYPSLTLLTSVTLNYTDKGSTKFSDAGVLPLPPSPSRQSKLSTSPPSVVKSFDFYRDGFVTEVKQCFPFLESLTVRVKELLAEWPDHPTLKQILVVIERILNFSLTSPISRFLTGLELLLDKMHEWEENAHAGVSLASHWKNVTGQIGSWRKLELQCWKDCLDNAENRAKAAASKWWFYIYSLVESFTSTDKKEDSAEVPSTQELIKSLQKFMEQSTLGEFEARLNIVFTFHCHIVHLQKMVHKDELMSIFWNIYGYYSQFSETVAAKIRELRTPIEKKLKDCVKIFRWDDISHWAIKEAIHKVHKTLHKHIKQFQDILNQPVASALTNPTSDENVGIWDRPQRHQHHRTYQCLLDPLNFISNSKLKKLTMESNGDKNEGSLLRRSGSLFMKARKLCQEIILNTSYAKHVQSVDGLITEIIEVSNHLKNLEVSSDLPKAKQKSQAKNFLQQKRKALADLFRTLQQMGVSYRTGLTYWNPDEESLSEFTIPPIDLRAAFQHLKNWRVDGLLLSVWEGCETYFLRSIARLALLNTSLQNPSKDLGPPAIERCRGFAMHLMVLSREQKLLLCESSHLLCSLRCHVAQLSAMEETDILLPRQSELQCWMIKLKELLVTCVSCLEQFRIFLYCCPDASCMSSSSVEPPVIEIEGLKSPEILQATKGNITWNSAVDRVKSLISSANKLKLTIERTEIVAPEMFHKRNKGKNTNKKPRMLVARAQFEALVDGYKQIEEFVKEIEDLKKIFDFSETLQQNADTETEKENKAREDINPMIASLLWLQKHIHDEAEKFSMFVENSNLRYFAFSSDESEVLASKDDFGQLENVKNFQDDVEAFLKNMLVVMQDVYKKYTQKNDGDIALKDDEIESAKEKDGSDQSKVERKDDDPGKEDESEIEDGHLKVKIIESLSSTVSMFLMNKTNEKLRVLMKKLVAILDTDDIQRGNVCKRLLLHCLPCLDQLVHLYQFFVTQQVASYRVSCKLLSVLLSIFLDLAQKGFCIPPEFAEKEGLEGDTTSGGMGLGEGEGEKDISEKIESEEQLEDARPKGEEKTEENEDCKEEEKGIEMSEDFDGKIQDLEKKEDAENDSDEDNDDDDEDLDKEMGETEPGADKLDQQIWGSDSEDEGDENEGEDKEEERGTGEKIGEPELSAKEDNSKPQEETEEENGDERKEQEPNRKEINEMDDADENSEQIDPYHGKHEPLPEPEPLDLPDDLQLDDGDEKQKGEEGEEENPFDIDKMKEQNVPQEEDKNMEEKSEEKEAAEEDQMDLGDEETEEINKEQDETEKSESADTGGGSKDEEKGGDEPKTEPEKEVDKETAKPSEDRPSDNPVEGATEMDQTYGSKDQVIPDKKEDSTQALDPSEDTSAEGKDDKEGVGQAQTEETDTGHTGEMVTRKDDVQTGRSQKEQNIERRRLQESDSNRSLGEVSEPVKKKLRTMNIAKDDMETQEEQEEEEDGVQEKESADMYQHIKESKKKFDAQALDAATKEQAEKQPVPNEEDTTGDEPKEDDDIEMQDNEDVEEENEIPTQKADKVASEKKRKERNEKRSGEKVDEGGDVDMSVEVEGEKIETLGAARGNESTFHTLFGEIQGDVSPQDIISADDYHALRSQLENQLSTWSEPPASTEAEKAWESFSTITSGLARDLSEQLRLVLEPTQASRLRGDYRTGRRINMRKVIPYIASQFRKDKIWLRRTKPSKREYQIVLAIDDSSSMADNHSKELAFESLALVSRALTLLEAGELAVISFGETPKILHQLGDPFTEQSGARLLQQFSFEQKKTRVGQLVDFATTMLTATRSRAASSAERAQLLVIISDGRIVSEGADRVKQAVRRARESGIFMVFVILDNPESKDSCLDIQHSVFSGGTFVGFSSYLDNFPFPFYLILRDINALPTVLSDALRQWFELVTNMDR